MSTKQRCAWVSQDQIYIDYHDHEWGVPLYDDQKLFEFVILDGMQAGLSWLTILKKRDNFRKSFDNFDPALVARYDIKRIEKLMADSGIIRNRLKINAAVTNAQAFLKLKEELGSFSDYLWNFVDHKPVKNHWKSIKQIPASTPLSDAVSKDLKQRGFKFVGSTICYAFLQAAGLINDHTTDCFCYK